VQCHLPLTRGARLSSLSPPRPTERARLAGKTEAARSSRCSLNRIPTEHQDPRVAAGIARVVEVRLGYKPRTRWPPHTHQSGRESICPGCHPGARLLGAVRTSGGGQGWVGMWCGFGSPQFDEEASDHGNRSPDFFPCCCLHYR
jgi:hypothetical protein